MTDPVASPEDFRRAMGCFATGVAVITILDAKGLPRGLTVNSLTSVSLDPPRLLWCLGDDAPHRQAFAEAESFNVNILAAGQDALSIRFADPTPAEVVEMPRDDGGRPFLRGGLARIACRRTHSLHIGDHLVIFGQVEVVEIAGRATAPLVFYKGGYGT